MRQISFIIREKTRMIPIYLEKRYRVVSCISIRFTMYFFGNKKYEICLESVQRSVMFIHGTKFDL